jgi:FkbM family methyltransferase
MSFHAYRHVSVADLAPYAHNARTHSDAQVAQIAASMRAWGFTNPVLVDEHNGLIAGHARVQAAQQVGMSIIPAIEVAGLSAAQKRALVLADNKLALNAGWDTDLLVAELGELKAEGFDLALTGFGELEITGLTAPPVDPNELWDGMPEYHFGAKAVRSIVVHFKTDADVSDFARRLEQPLSEKTKYLWHPAQEEQTLADKAWMTEPSGAPQPEAVADVTIPKHVQGGNVPGGHFVLQNPGKPPFVPDMKTCNAVPLRHSDVVVDVGAFVGTYAIRAARFPVRRVIAYEPTPRSFAVMAMTQLGNLEQHQAAVAATAGEMTFYLSSGIGVRNSLVPSDRKAPITVPAIAYADAVREATIVKIDIEGGEYGLPIVQPSLRAIILEFHKVPKFNWRERAEQIIGEIEAAGFRAIVTPNWNTGFSWGFTFLRDRPDDGSGAADLLAGAVCCGCGAAIVPAGQKAVCHACWPQWMPRHRGGFIEAERLADLAA